MATAAGGLGIGVEPLPRVSSASLIAERVRAGILSGALEPGTQLNAASLATTFNVSRGPVREALQRLIQEGLLDNRPHRGVFVADLDPTDIADVYVARHAVEGAAAARVVSALPDDFGDTMQEELDQMRRAAKRGEWAVVVDHDLRFHELLVDASGSHRLNRMFATLIAETRLCLSRLGASYPVPEHLVDEHAELLDLLLRRDLVAFLDALAIHFGAAVDALADQPTR